MSEKNQAAEKKPAAEALAPRQVKILAALAKAKGPMPKPTVVAKSGVNPNWVAEMLGTGLPGCVERVSGKGPLKLVPAGLARVVVLPVDGSKHGERCWEITAKGRKALERHEREAAAGKAAKKAPAAKKAAAVKGQPATA